ncbi:hypothetical protein MRB53_006142 [Persea americana]|uniref:Uncharacterized protein n=1 Tax=Persea americana TaxID=3435 RepID=A0ACC2MFC0_PERAE|nr:hypothetical protein MRB53_006142 [Persea americana]
MASSGENHFLSNLFDLSPYHSCFLHLPRRILAAEKTLPSKKRQQEEEGLTRFNNTLLLLPLLSPKSNLRSRGSSSHGRNGGRSYEPNLPSPSTPHPHQLKTLINPRIQVLVLLQDHQRPFLLDPPNHSHRFFSS